eukprot:6177975-Pleurochrysis_carterae.AAC.1
MEKGRRCAAFSSRSWWTHTCSYLSESSHWMTVGRSRGGRGTPFAHPSDAKKVSCPSALEEES